MAKGTSWAVGVGMVLAAFGGGFVAQALLGGRAVHAQEAAAKELRVQRLVVVDEQNRELGLLEAKGDSVQLMMRDVDGRPRLVLGCLLNLGDHAAWTLQFLDARGLPRVIWGLRDDGHQATGLLIGEPVEGKVRAILLREDDLGVGISVVDQMADQGLTMGVKPDSGGVVTGTDGQGKELWRFPDANEAPGQP